MKNIQFIASDGCKDKLLDYPCVDSNTQYLHDRKVCIFDSNKLIQQEWFSKLGATVILNPDNKGTSFTNVGIVAPIKPTQDDEHGYYEILDYYISTLQLLIHKQKGLDAFNHIVVILPPHSDEYSTSLTKMAFYSVYGLIKGLGELYAPDGLFINGIIQNENNDEKILKDWITLLSSDNSNNIVGQVFKL